MAKHRAAKHRAEKKRPVRKHGVALVAAPVAATITLSTVGVGYGTAQDPVEQVVVSQSVGLERLSERAVGTSRSASRADAAAAEAREAREARQAAAEQRPPSRPPPRAPPSSRTRAPPSGRRTGGHAAVDHRGAQPLVRARGVRRAARHRLRGGEGAGHRTLRGRARRDRGRRASRGGSPRATSPRRSPPRPASTCPARTGRRSRPREPQQRREGPRGGLRQLPGHHDLRHAAQRRRARPGPGHRHHGLGRPGYEVADFLQANYAELGINYT